MRNVHSVGWSMLIALGCLFGQTAIAQSFRFAWLSDTHVGSPTGAEDLRSSVRDINAGDDIAFVILSGDITEMGWDPELRLAKRILDSLRVPYYIIPGNHDTKWSESGCTMFPRLWGADRFVFQHEGHLFIGLHQGPIMRMGDGHFAPEDLRWLDSVLAGIPNPAQPLVFVTHYPLDPSIDNWYELLERLEHLNTKAVLVGHGHGNRVHSFEGIPGIIGRSNLRARDFEGGYTLVEIGSDSMSFSERRPLSGNTTRWHAISLTSPNGGEIDAPRRRPDFSINSKYPGVRVRWTYETGYTIASAPVLGDGTVVAGSGKGEVLCLSVQDGSLIWRFSTGSAVYSTPEIASGKVIFGSTDGFIYCVALHDGCLLWKYQTQAPVVAAPKVSDDVVYVGGSDGKFRAIDITSGALKWEFDGVGAFVETKPLVLEGEVIFGAWDTYLYALDKEAGSLLWKWSNGNPTFNLSPAACWPVVAAGLVYIVAPDRYMTTLTPLDGATIWRSRDHQVRESVGASEDQNRIYAKTITDTLLCFSAGSKGPELLWATACGYGYDIDPCMPIEKEGSVFFGTKNGVVYSVDGQTGAIKWQHKIGVTIVNTPAPVGPNKVIITDFDGRISLIEDPGESSLEE